MASPISGWGLPGTQDPLLKAGFGGHLIARGLFSIAYGLFALLWPGAALYSVALIFGAYVFLDGILALTTHRHFVPGGRGGLSAAPILEGVLGILAGLISFLFPGITAAALALLMGAWAVATGFVEIGAAFSAHALGPLGRTLYALAGLASVVVGALILTWPILGAWALITLVAVYAMSFGFFMTSLGLHLRHRATVPDRRSRESQPQNEIGRAA